MEPAPPAALTTATLRALRRILRESERGGRKLAAATGLTPSQLLVLQEVDRRGTTTPSSVASTLHFGQATVTAIVDRLERAGLVTRTRGASDRRTFQLAATEAGRAALDAAPSLLQERFIDQFPTLPDWEQAMMLAALERLADLLGATNRDAAPLIDTGAIDRAEPRA